MHPETLETTIDELLQQNPFHPFTLAMSDGSLLEIDHPKAVHFFRGFGTFVGPGGRPQFFEAGGVNRVIADLAESQKDRAKSA